ncbi:MAG: hypothetical protein HS107_10355 [Thermoflexaceae bacterium]|nr:hypothetical protein [Thermoflexaceae bacterium]
MSSVYLICRDARADSLITNLALGLQLRAGGDDVAVLFTGESLCAFTGETWHWPRHLAGRPAQVAIAAGAPGAGLSLNAEFDRRWLDLEKLIQQATDAGIRLVACPLWTDLLGIGAALPACLARPDMEQLLGELRSARQVIGGF